MRNDKKEEITRRKTGEKREKPVKRRKIKRPPPEPVPGPTPNVSTSNAVTIPDSRRDEPIAQAEHNGNISQVQLAAVKPGSERKGSVSTAQSKPTNPGNPSLPVPDPTQIPRAGRRGAITQAEHNGSTSQVQLAAARPDSKGGGSTSTARSTRTSTKPNTILTTEEQETLKRQEEHLPEPKLQKEGELTTALWNVNGIGALVTGRPCYSHSS